MSTLTEFLLENLREDEDLAADLDMGWRSFVICDIKAKRRIVELHDRNHECSGYDDEGEIDNCQWIDGRDCSTLLLLASVYSDQLGYRDEWRVEVTP